jgi:hypothetical protein
LDRAGLLLQLQRESPLESLAGLTLPEAKRVLKRFEGMAVFEPDLERSIRDFDETRDRIQEMEEMARSGGSSRED